MAKIAIHKFIPIKYNNQADIFIGLIIFMNYSRVLFYVKNVQKEYTLLHPH
jgi:hypothetical protein